MTETRRSVMQGRLTDAVFGALWLGVLGLAAIVMLLLAVAPGIPFVIRVLSAGAMVVMAAWVRLERREAFPAAGRLRLEASDDALVFQMPGQPAEVVPRADIELIILDESPFGVGSLSVFGPDENLLPCGDGNTGIDCSTGPPDGAATRLKAELRPAAAA